MPVQTEPGRGAVRTRYSCLSMVRPTLRLAKLFQADVVGVGEYLQLDLEPVV